jgi:serine palmitoyltransferase
VYSRRNKPVVHGLSAVPSLPYGLKPATLDQVVYTSRSGKFVEIEGHDGKLLDCASMDFLGFSSCDEVKKVSREVLNEYTVGSCGPRGFYGTTDKHLSLEAAIAQAMGTNQSISYSDSVATVASAIPAFAKRQDVLVVDDGVNHAIQTGCSLSRCKTVVFRHNDMLDLERALKSVSDTSGRHAAKGTRLFIVVEGIYVNRGDLCPLNEVVRLARRYCFRIILDDSMGFGVLGAKGRGTAEHFGMEPTDIDITLASMTTTLGSVGGFCFGSDEVVDHQRLSGAGYVFSASLPPFLCATAELSLGLMMSKPSLLRALRANAKALYDALNVSRARFKVVSSFAESPVVHLRLAWHSDTGANDASRLSRARDKSMEDSSSLFGEDASQSSRVKKPRRRFQSSEDDDIDLVVREAIERGVLISRSRYLVTDSFAPANALRVSVNALMTKADIEHIVDTVSEAVEKAFEARSQAKDSPVKQRVPRA